MSLRPLRLLSLLSALLLASWAAQASTSVFISVHSAPPALPVYEQPYCPGPGYVWTPGYWGWNGDDYYWVPGTWVLAPVGMLWTPGYWGWADNVYVWHGGYWGPRVGYYGGINYGHGYSGSGYAGGYWRNRVFYYNRSVNHVDSRRVTHVYSRHVTVNRINVTRVSYNGGDGGTRTRPSHDEEAYARHRHTGPTEAQRRHEQDARNDRRMNASENHGRPPPRVGEHRDRGSQPEHSASPHRDDHGNDRNVHGGEQHPPRASGSSQASHGHGGKAGHRPNEAPQHAQHRPPQAPRQPSGREGQRNGAPQQVHQPQRTQRQRSGSPRQQHMGAPQRHDHQPVPNQLPAQESGHRQNRQL
ncbi:YXWGXW repeat-containing protein [Solimonas terrae]|uniref:BcpO-related WXXGXW repeat protein n=1 Tax=Solimonas terrae TaxID=1396819 RepID=A0A6M2BW61_9GAMM|nr:YXWGXW repeat-containing protein [Solimonas terrae]NGY06505.1 BcpO-related WXXGXW repeat protein [Solimonas terrae]